mmetsp:Transcript_23484/g.75209  ORF Transcript_23484/g.75209 Transcript_23484/m.75209 type:complete len:470 (+) Transcript_23484:30-1439(+)
MCRVSRYKDKVHPCLCAPVRDCLVQEHAQRRGHVGLAGITVLVLVAVKIRAVVADVRVQLLANVGPARLLPDGPQAGAVPRRPLGEAVGVRSNRVPHECDLRAVGEEAVVRLLGLRRVARAAHVLRERTVFERPRERRISWRAQHGRERGAVETGRRLWVERSARELGHGGKDVDQLGEHGAPRPHALPHPRRAHDERHARAMLEIAELLPLAVLAQRPAVVRVQRDERRGGQAACLELVEHASDLRVDPCYSSAIVPSPLVCRRICHRCVDVRLRHSVVVRNRRHCRAQRGVRRHVTLDERQKGRGEAEGQVRFAEADCQEEGRVHRCQSQLEHRVIGNDAVTELLRRQRRSDGAAHVGVDRACVGVGWRQANLAVPHVCHVIDTLHRETRRPAGRVLVGRHAWAVEVRVGVARASLLGVENLARGKRNPPRPLEVLRQRDPRRPRAQRATRARNRPAVCGPRAGPRL